MCVYSMSIYRNTMSRLHRFSMRVYKDVHIFMIIISSINTIHKTVVAIVHDLFLDDYSSSYTTGIFIITVVAY